MGDLESFRPRSRWAKYSNLSDDSCLELEVVGCYTDNSIRYWPTTD